MGKVVIIPLIKDKLGKKISTKENIPNDEKKFKQVISWLRRNIGEPFSNVCAIVLTKNFTIYTYISKKDKYLRGQLYDMEMKCMDKFLKINFDFHVVEFKPFSLMSFEGSLIYLNLKNEKI